VSNPSLVIVLVEDEHHRMLVRRYLTECGLKEHAIRIHQSPSGRGSAEGWVLKRFVEETRVYRNLATRAGTALIAMTDADNHSVQERMTRLDQALVEFGQPKIGKSERIARLVPRRNIETWILCLNDEQDESETTDYTSQSRNWHELIPRAADVLSQWTRPNTELPSRCVDSLRIGVQELKSLRY